MKFGDAMKELGKTLTRETGERAVYERGSGVTPLQIEMRVCSVMDPNRDLGPGIPVMQETVDFYIMVSEFYGKGEDSLFPPKHGDRILTTAGEFKVIGREASDHFVGRQSKENSSSFEYVTSERDRIIVTAVKVSKNGIL